MPNLSGLDVTNINATNIRPSGNVSTLGELWDFNNNATGGMYGSLTVLMVWVIIFLKMNEKNRASVSALTASFATLMLSYIMVAGGMLYPHILIINAIMFIVSIIWTYAGQRR